MLSGRCSTYRLHFLKRLDSSSHALRGVHAAVKPVSALIFGARTHYNEVIDHCVQEGELDKALRASTAEVCQHHASGHCRPTRG